MLQPVRRRTWAPRGETPIQRCAGPRGHISAISAIMVSPLRRRLGLYFTIHERSIRTQEALSFMLSVRRSLRRRVIFVLDRLNVHRAAARHLLARHADTVEVEWLPPYAPDLNPAEGIWDHTKYADLANYIPADTRALRREVERSFVRQHSTPSLCFILFSNTRNSNYEAFHCLYEVQ